MKRTILILTALIYTGLLFSQSPERLSYQAVIRGSSNNLVTNSTVGMQLSILKGSSTGTAVYVETQSPVTNENGLISIELGAGSVVSGNFASIDWSDGPYFIKTETDPSGGSIYTITGTSQLLSVPYALYSRTASDISGGISGTVGIKTQPTKATIQVGKEATNFYSNSFLDVDTAKDRSIVVSGLWDAGTHSKSLLYLNGNRVNPGETTGRISFSSGAYENAAIEGIEGSNSDWSGEIIFSTRNDNNPMTEKMRITQNGYIGIGTSSPVSQLTVNGVIESSSGGIKFPDGTTQTTAVSSAPGLPAGMIVPFAGDAAHVPAGWALCDGSELSRIEYADLFGVIGTGYGSGDNSTTFNLPDLRGMFLRGADNGRGADPDASARTESSTGSNSGDMVGSMQTGATAFPLNPFVTDPQGNHSHLVSVAGVSGHTHSGVTGTAGNHSHYINDPQSGNPMYVHGITSFSPGPGANLWVISDSGDRLQTGGSAEHAHSLSIMSAGAHTHSATTAPTGVHIHSVSGGDAETRPVNVYVNYIIKL